MLACLNGSILARCIVASVLLCPCLVSPAAAKTIYSKRIALFAPGNTLPQRLVETSEVIRITSARDAVYLGYRASDVEGTPSGRPVGGLSPPMGVKAEAVETGRLSAGGYVYYVESHYTVAGATKQLGRGYRAAATEDDSAVVVDFADLTSEVIRQIHSLQKFGEPKIDEAPAAPDDEPDGDGMDEVLGGDEDGQETEERAVSGGYRVYRRGANERDFQLVKEIPNLDAATWIDRGVTRSGEPARKRISLSDADTRTQLESYCGILPQGTYFYAISAFDTQGESATCEPVPVTTHGEGNQVRLAWQPVYGAVGYRVYRTQQKGGFANSLIGLVEYPQWSWVDVGYPAGEGIRVLVQARQGVDKESCLGAAWQDVPSLAQTREHGRPLRSLRFGESRPGAAHVLKLDLARGRYVQYRVEGLASFDCGRREVEVFVTEDAPSVRMTASTLEAAKPIIEEACYWRSTAIIADEATLPAGPYPKRRKMNAVFVATGNGIGHREDFDIQFYNPVAGFWDSIYRVRGNFDRQNILYVFPATDVSGVRTLGPFSSRGNGFDQAPSFAAAYLPVVPLRLAINDEFLSERGYPVNAYSARLSARNGVNVVAFDLQNLAPQATRAKVSLVVEKEWREELRPQETDEGERRRIEKEEGEPVPEPAPLEATSNETTKEAPQIVTRTKRISENTMSVALGTGESRSVRMQFLVRALRPRTCFLVTLQVDEEPSGRRLLRYPFRLDGASPIALRLVKPRYRNAIHATEQDKTVLVEIALRLHPVFRGMSRLTLEILDRQQAIVHSHVFDPLLTARVEAKYDASQLTPGRYKIRAFLSSKSGLRLASSETALFVRAPARNECRLRDDGVLLANEKPFFPIGLYSVPEDDAVMKELSEAGFNCVVWYSPRYYPAFSPSRARTYLDHLQRHGLKGILATPEPDLTNNKEAAEEFLEKMVVPLRRHPALLAWYLADEPHHSTTDQKGFHQGYRRFCQVDPHHPATLVQQPASPAAYSWFAHAMDALMIDIYPRFTLDEGPENLRYPDFIRHCMAAARQAGNREKPVWYVPPAWTPRRWTPWSKKKNRLPTIQEQRTMAYTAIIHGAKGIVWFGFEAETDCAKHNCTVPGLWPAFKALAGELSFLAPVLAAPGSSQRVSVQPDDGVIQALLKDHQGEQYLFAVNASRRKVSATFRIPRIGDHVTKLSVISEDRSVQIEKDAFRDAFGPYQVHLYTTKSRLPSLPLRKYLNDPTLQFTVPPEQKANLALFTKGVTWRASSYYPGVGGPLGMQAIDANPYSWWEGTDSSPWVEILFPQPTRMNRIVVAFQCSRIFDDPNVWKAGARDFSIEYWHDGKWTHISTVKNNKEQTVTTRFPAVTTTKLRVKLLRAMLSDEPGGRICAIEAYED